MFYLGYYYVHGKLAVSILLIKFPVDLYHAVNILVMFTVSNNSNEG